MNPVSFKRSPWLLLLALLFGLTLARQVWTFYTFAGLRNDSLEVLARTLPTMLAALTVALIANKQQKPWRTPLIWLTASLLCFALGMLINGVLDFVLHVNAFPSLGDVLSTVAMPLLVTAFMALPHNRSLALERLRLSLDAGIIVTMIASYCWFFVLAPAIAAHLARGGISLPVMVAMSYPVYDLIALSVMLIVSAQWQRANAGSELLLMMAAVLCWLLADGYFLARCFIRGLPVTHPLEAGWAWGCALFALVAYRSLRWRDPAFRAERLARGQFGDNGAVPRRWPSDWLTRYGAYLALPASVLLLAFAQGSTSLRWLGVEVTAGLVVLLVIARQIVLALELQRANHELQQLSSGLESRVAQRTQQLEESRARELQRTRVLEMIAWDESLEKIQAQAALLDPAAGENLNHLATERRHLLERLEVQATRDALTGLPNRTHCLRSLVKALEDAQISQRAVAVLYIDLDRFKDINDTLGHPIGDTVLCEVARRLKSCVPESGLLARLGGDEFMIVLPDLAPGAAQQAEQLGQALIAVMRPAIRVNDAELFVTVSVGMSLFPDNGSDAVSLQRYADTAMYHAKHEGAGYHAFTPDLSLHAERRLNVESLLRRALDTDVGQSFYLLYQPIVDAGLNRVVAIEALLRCSDTALDVSPAELIPVAERSGLIVALGNWVLEEACRQNAVWHNAGLSVRVNVNVSTIQFERPDFVEAVRRALSRSGLPASRLTLELLESVLVSRFDEIASRMAELREMGVQLALDDFGAGYSSLSYLGRLTFDALKIDRSFTFALGSERDSLPLVASVLSIAQVFGMDAVAEGVETPAQLESLRALGCQHVQGYLFARPLPASEIEGLLRGEFVKP